MSTAIRGIELALIDESPTHPREAFEGIEELGADIEVRGLLSPLVIREKRGGRFELASGARRLRALKLKGAMYAACTVRELDDSDVAIMPLVDDAHHSNLLPMERARAFRRLMHEFKFTREKIASSIHKSVSYVQEQLRLLNLPDEAQKVIKKAGLSPTHARYIARQETDAKRVEMAKALAEKPMSVIEARAAFGQIRSASLYVRGQLVMQARIVDALRRAATEAEEDGDDGIAKCLRAQAEAVEQMKPLEKQPHRVVRRNSAA